MVSTEKQKTGSHLFFLLLLFCTFVCTCVFVTRLKGNLAKHHPDVSKVKVAAEGFGSAVVQIHGDVASTRIPVIQHRPELHRPRLRYKVGLKPTGDRGEDLHIAGEHVVAVDLDGE